MMCLPKPIDVSFNGPIKRVMSDWWNDWLGAERFQSGWDIKTAPNKLIMTWIVEVHWALKPEICQSTWKRKEFEWVYQLTVTIK